jgi:hypothetical protein
MLAMCHLCESKKAALAALPRGNPRPLRTKLLLVLLHKEEDRVLALKETRPVFYCRLIPTDVVDFHPARATRPARHLSGSLRGRTSRRCQLAGERKPVIYSRSPEAATMRLGCALLPWRHGARWLKPGHRPGVFVRDANSRLILFRQGREPFVLFRVAGQENKKSLTCEIVI